MHAGEDPDLVVAGSIAGVKMENRAVPMVFPPSKLLAAGLMLLTGVVLAGVAGTIQLPVEELRASHLELAAEAARRLFGLYNVDITTDVIRDWQTKFINPAVLSTG